MSKLTYISSSHGDWCGIYINKDLCVEGHSISINDWLYICTKDIFLETVSKEVDGEWLEYQGFLPPRLSDIPQDKFV